jgi:phenylacetate-CoA ligase
MSGGQTEKQVQQIVDFQPRIIMVTPSYSLVIAEELSAWASRLTRFP